MMLQNIRQNPGIFLKKGTEKKSISIDRNKNMRKSFDKREKKLGIDLRGGYPKTVVNSHKQGPIGP
jgi:hypothetical protein